MTGRGLQWKVRRGGGDHMAKIKEGLGERSPKLHKRPRCRRAALVKMWVGTRGWAVGSPQFVDGRTPPWSEALDKAGIG